LDKRFPEDTSVQVSYLPSLQARIALNHGDVAKAIRVLETSIPYELGTPRSAIHGNFGAMYPVYFRGEAYLAAHQGAQAAAEFQKILEHPGIVTSDPISVIALLQQARAYAMQGETGRAKEIYAKFLALWRDADMNIPLFRQARSELTRMQ
jgi:tetratricopeptide (TPR) repeat protein